MRVIRIPDFIMPGGYDYHLTDFFKCYLEDITRELTLINLTDVLTPSQLDRELLLMSGVESLIGENRELTILVRSKALSLDSEFALNTGWLDISDIDYADVILLIEASLVSKHREFANSINRTVDASVAIVRDHYNFVMNHYEHFVKEYELHRNMSNRIS